jgi:integrase
MSVIKRYIKSEVAMKNAQITTISEFEPVILMVTNGLTSEHSRRAYRRAIRDFLTWWEPGRAPLVKMTVLAYRAALVDQGLSAANINLRMSAIRKMVAEAADHRMLAQHAANGIARIKGVKSVGVRVGNWLTRRQAQDLINSVQVDTLKGLRDRAILAVQIGAGLRRSEVAALTFEHIQQREGRWVIVDLVGKGRRVRTVPIPSWVKVAIEAWSQAAGIGSGYIFRPLDRGDHLAGGDRVTAQLVYRVVAEYASRMGFDVAAHDLRRTFAKLAHKGGAGVDQIQLTLGHASLKTTERYLGIEQNLADAPCDRLGLDLSGD